MSNVRISEAGTLTIWSNKTGEAIAAANSHIGIALRPHSSAFLRG
jgi:hypothetical protein